MLPFSIVPSVIACTMIFEFILQSLCHISTQTTMSAMPSFELGILIRFSVIIFNEARHPTLNLHQLHMQVTSRKGKVLGCAA